MVIFKYFVVKMISVKIGNKQKRGQDGPFLKKAFTYVTIALLCLKIIKANLSGLTSKNISL